LFRERTQNEQQLASEKRKLKAEDLKQLKEQQKRVRLAAIDKIVEKVKHHDNIVNGLKHSQSVYHQTLS